MSYYTFILLGMLLAALTLWLRVWSWFMDFSIMNLSGVTLMSFSFIFDKDSLAFLMTVLTIFSMVYFYSFSYLSSEIYLKRFLVILSLFVCSMCLLILSGNLFSSLIGWDGLGVTSMFLILFYYSKSSFKASTLTFLMNRVGDSLLILTLVQVILLGESLIFYSSFLSSEISTLIILTSLTKSAQIPFSTWLPAAMEAPTPVSALVHSSTLVTAGIYLLYRYSILWVESEVKELLVILSLSTCFMAALSAMVETDLKKLIALSTLSQLGFIMFSLSLGMLTQGFLHMLMHAYFKALLFMCAGLMIHSFKGSQSIMYLNMSQSQNPILIMITSCSLMSMSGLPYLSGFYSKDLILDSFKMLKWSMLLLMMLVLSLVCTILYSVRMIWYLLNSSSNWHCMSDENFNMVKPMVPLAILASTSGSLVTWVGMENEVYIETSKVFILLFLSLSSAGYWYFKQTKTIFFLESKWNLSVFNTILSEIFFQSTSFYNKSSDTLGIPEILLKKMKDSISKTSSKVSKTMLNYSGNYEFFLFLTAILVVL